jgi:hypothetical protein
VQVNNPNPTRIGIIIDSFAQPCWVRRSLEKVLATRQSTFELLIKVAKENAEDSFLYKLYNRMDRSMFAGKPDALEVVSIEDLVGSLPSLDAEQLEQIREFKLDMLLNFGPTELNSKFADVTRYGVWFHTFGVNEKTPPGVSEVLAEAPITVSSIRSVSGAPPAEQTIYQSVGPALSRFSAALNYNSRYWKSSAFMARSLVNLHNGHNDSAREITHHTDGSLKPLTNAAMGQMFFKLSGRAASRAIEKVSFSEQWVLAYRLNQTEFKYLIPPDDRFWADPFPIKVGGKYYIFFEEYLKSAKRAHISVVEVDQQGIVSGPREALKLDCHLSYPFVFEWHGDYYMIPETGDKNVVELYRSTSFPFQWQHERVLLEAERPLDATLAEVNGTWWMFVNIQEKGVLVNWDELHLYYADSPLGPWKAHAHNPVVSDVRSARPAGALFWANNVLYRPGQDSSLRYGYATKINRIDRITPTEYRETEVAKILPDWDRDILGVHTLNSLNELTVIDCLTRRGRFRRGKLRPPPGLGTIEDLLLARFSVVG